MKTQLAGLGPKERRTYFGLLSAVAHADRRLDDGEVTLFAKLVKIHAGHLPGDPVSDDLRSTTPLPPELAIRLQGSDARFALYLDAAMMARADGMVSDEEVWLLNGLQRRLSITQDQAVALCNLSIAALLLEQKRPTQAHAERQLLTAEARLISEDVPSASVRHVRRFSES